MYQKITRRSTETATAVESLLKERRGSAPIAGLGGSDRPKWMLGCPWSLSTRRAPDPGLHYVGASRGSLRLAEPPSSALEHLQREAE
jgi:hypothetical protein